MSDLTGYNFSPDLANRFRSSLNNPTGAGQLPQNVGQALQVLSLHLPSFVGGSPIAPDALLRPSHAFTPDAAVRSMTTGTPAPSAMSATPQPAPVAPTGQSPSLSVFQPSQGGGPASPGTAMSSPVAPQAPDAAMQGAPAAPTPLPSFQFGSGSAPLSGGSGGSDTSGLMNLLNGFLRGGSGGGGSTFGPQ